MELHREGSGPAACAAGLFYHFESEVCTLPETLSYAPAPLRYKPGTASVTSALHCNTWFNALQYSTLCMYTEHCHAVQCAVQCHLVMQGKVQCSTAHSISVHLNRLEFSSVQCYMSPGQGFPVSAIPESR